MKKSLPFLVAIVLLLAAAGGYYYVQNPSAPAPERVTETPAAVPADGVEPIVRYPLPEPAAPETTAESEPEPAPLPSMEESDPAMGQVLAQLFGEAGAALFKDEHLISRMAVTIDNLPRAQVAPKFLPLRPVPGGFVTSGGDDALYLSPDNYPRYAPYVEAAARLDAEAAVDQYVRLYPLFQQALVSLGYPRDYFNDRLMDVIDQLLATPEIAEPIRLVRPNVIYKFADPALEALPAGQKLLLRMGPDNAAVVKAKLRELREALLRRVEH